MTELTRTNHATFEGVTTPLGEDVRIECDEGYAIEAQSRGEVEVPDMPVTGDDPRRVAVVSENGDIEIRIA